MTHLHSVLVSYNRLSLTQQAIESYYDTVTIPHSLIVVDNGSNEETTSWLIHSNLDVVLLHKNRYPGYATNNGWKLLWPETTLLQRIDNDVKFLPNWCDEMLEAFEDPIVGQYGLIADGDQEWTSMPVWPVGGNSIIRRELYDKGLRYSEYPWSPGYAECPGFTADVHALGYTHRFGTRPGIEFYDDGDENYRRRTHEARGLTVSDWTGKTL